MNFYDRLLQVLTWLTWKTNRAEIITFYRPKRGVVFSKIRIGGITIEGEITKMKVEFGQRVRVKVKPIGGKGFEAGTEKFSMKMQDSTGSDASGDWQVIPNPSDPLECDFQHNGNEVESMGVIAFEADGDRDVDETATVVGTLDIVLDEPNVTAVELEGSIVTGEPTPAPEPAPEG